MTRRDCLYERHRLPPGIIQPAIWLYFCVTLSHLDIEDLLARRGIVATHESIRLWCNEFGPRYAHRLRRGYRGYSDAVFMDEAFVRIRGQSQYLWRAVDQDWEVVDVLLQERRDAASARRFFRHLLKRLGIELRMIVTDNRAEPSHQPTRVRERGMTQFKFMCQALRFVHIHAAVANLFNPGRPLVAVDHYRTLRQRAFASCDLAVAI